MEIIITNFDNSRKSLMSGSAVVNSFAFVKQRSNWGFKLRICVKELWSYDNDIAIDIIILTNAFINFTLKLW